MLNASVSKFKVRRALLNASNGIHRLRDERLSAPHRAKTGRVGDPAQARNSIPTTRKSRVAGAPRKRIARR